MESKSYEIHFAPLQGYTDVAFRNAFETYFGGVDTYYTPFIRIEKGDFRKKDVREIAMEANTVRKLVPQLLAGNRDEFCRLADLLQAQGYREADINLGCSFPPIAGKQRGSGMLPHPELVAEMLKAMLEYPELRFSVKMRLGWEDPRECLELIPILNDFPLQHLTIHARVGKQQYKGETQPEAFAAFYECYQRPLFYNGDLLTVEDIRKIIQQFPNLKGVSLGRGLLSDPFLASEFKENMSKDSREKMEICRNFHDHLLSNYATTLQGDSHLLMKMKTFWEYFLPETDRKLLKAIKKANKLQQYTDAVRKIWTI